MKMNNITINGMAIHEWQTPDFIILKDSNTGALLDTSVVTIPISKVGPDTLSRVCDQFREDVFRKAGVMDPRKV